MSDSSQPSNSLGDNGLRLGIIASSLTFLILLITLVASKARFFQPISKLFFIVDGLGAFIGFLAVVLGFAGLFGRNVPRGSSSVGIFLGLLGISLFYIFVRVLR